MEDIIDVMANDLTTKPAFQYENVNLNEFFDDKSSEELKNEEAGIAFLTDHQQKLVDNLRTSLKSISPNKLELINNNLSNIEVLAKAISKFPSLLERYNTVAAVRTPDSLVENIISYQQDGDTTLHMPAKASLGKGLLISKIHIFNSMAKIAAKYTKFTDKQIKEYQDEAISMMFTLMAEDVYMNLIKDASISMELRRQLGRSLIILWEYRSDQTINDIAPVLQSVWSARRTLAPAFGTMMGTSELLLVSIQMDGTWRDFIKQRLGDPEVSQAMEEFLFGLSHEQICRLREILRNQGVKAIGRDEVSNYLGERVKTDVSLDYRDFYLLYTVRRDNARGRKRFKLEGPKNTLEDYYIRFVMEQNIEKQKNDTFAK